MEEASVAIGALLPYHHPVTGGDGAYVRFLKEELARLGSPPARPLTAEGCLAAMCLMRSCCNRPRSDDEQEELRADEVVVAFVESALTHPDYSVQQVPRLKSNGALLWGRAEKLLVNSIQ